MALEKPTDKEVREAIEHIERLRKDPARFEHWVERVMAGSQKKKKSSQKLSKISKNR